MTEHMTKERKEEIRQKVSIRDTSILRFYEMIELLNELDCLETELQKKELKIKSFCKNDCDGGKEMDLCSVCSLGSLLDAHKPDDEKCPDCDGSGYELLLEDDGDRQYPVPNGLCQTCGGTGNKPKSVPNLHINKNPGDNLNE